jgi:uncharacterized protein
MKLERRVITFAAGQRPELRAKGDGAGQFSGHAAVFNKLSVELFGFYERIAESAFDDAIDGKNDVRFLINHDSNLVLARNKLGDGTLSLSKDSVGLVSEADLPDTTFARDISESLKRGDVDQMSFGFRTLEDTWEEEELDVEVDGETKQLTITVRTLERVELFDVSVVTFPAYPDTDAGLRYLGMASPSSAIAQAHVRIGVDASELDQVMKGLEELGQRKGKVLSKKNRDAIDAAIEALNGVLEGASVDDDAGEENSAAVDLELRRARIRALELDVPTLPTSLR